MQYLIGVDGGGTGCRAVVSDCAGNRLGFGQSGPANIMTNFDAAKENVIEACQSAFHDADIAPDQIHTAKAYLGLAGANGGDYAARMVGSLPFRESIVKTDATISLEGAIGAADGAVAIIGTGSIFIYRINGVVHTVGGWGYMVGDLGSGSRLGQLLLQETLLVYDGIHDGSDLTRKVLSKFEEDPNTIMEYAHQALPGEFGTFAPLVFEYAKTRDPVAQKILRKAVADVEETLETILVDETQSFCMLGGLGTLYGDLLNSNLRKRIQEPLGDAVTGAISLAIKHFASPEMVS